MVECKSYQCSCIELENANPRDGHVFVHLGNARNAYQEANPASPLGSAAGWGARGSWPEARVVLGGSCRAARRGVRACLSCVTVWRIASQGATMPEVERRRKMAKRWEANPAASVLAVRVKGTAWRCRRRTQRGAGVSRHSPGSCSLLYIMYSKSGL